MIELEIRNTDSKWKQPLRVFAAKTQREAVDCGVKRYTEMGWPLPETCYVITKRICFEVYFPVTVKEPK